MDAGKKQDPLEEYLSFVRHELRTQLWVVREGISQVLDGLGKKDCAKCFDILKAAIESVDEMTKITERLLSAGEVKSKLEDDTGCGGAA